MLMHASAHNYLPADLALTLALALAVCGQVAIDAEVLAEFCGFLVFGSGVSAGQLIYLAESGVRPRARVEPRNGAVANGPNDVLGFNLMINDVLGFVQ
jgi:hypothetical protein